MSKVLTIAIPTYNIEDYIGRCLDSFIDVDSKYYSLFELIVVNDGSKDNSAEIVEKYIKDNPNLDLKLITKENGGHGSAVNRGIDEAKGKYFKVIDGDDWVKKEDFEIFIDKLQYVDVDMVVTDYTEQHVYNNTTRLKKPPIMDENIVLDGLPSERIFMHAATYKTKILKDNNIRLSEKIFYVDMQYTLFTLEYVNNYIYWALDVYQYFLGRADQSMNINSMIKNASHHLIVTKSILDFYDKTDDIALKNILVGSLNELVNTQFLISYMSQEKNELINQLMLDLKNSKYEYKFSKDKKTSYLIYLNEKTNRKFKVLFNPLIDKKISSIRG